MDPYDPDNFDWGDDDTPNTPEYADEAQSLTDFITAALKVHDDKFGWTWIKKRDIKETAKRLYRCKVIVPEEKRAGLEEEWPAYNFIWDHATKHHDHPVSHVTTELNYLEMVEDYIRKDVQWIDLFGNSGHAEKYKTKSVVLFEKNTPKDFLRYQNLNPRDLKLDMRSLCDPSSSLGKIMDVTIVHALYYMSMDDIAKILHTAPGRKIKALVHRHPSVKGTLNGGELEYSVDMNGIVRQTNVLTGEAYQHPSLEAMFHQFSAKTENGGVAWTIKKAGGDAFFIDLVGCTNEVAEEFTPLWLLKPETRVVVETQSVKMTQFLHWTWVTYNTGNREVALDDVDLLKKLRSYVSGKQRTPLLMRELSNYARRLTNKADIISIHGGGAHEVATGMVVDYVQAAFYMDVQHELEVAISMAKKNKEMVEALNAYYEKGIMPVSVVAVHKTAWKAGKTAKTAFKAFHDIGMKAYGVVDGEIGRRAPAPVRAAAMYLGGNHADHVDWSRVPWPSGLDD